MTSKERCNEDEKAVEEDRLSRLPDDLIDKILSLISMREAIRTCVLSPRWRSMWTSLTSLSFSEGDLSPEFVSNVLYRRNDELQLSSVEVGLASEYSQECVERILEYASSHNVQQLSLITRRCVSENMERALSSFEATLPALTRLHLECIELCDGKFNGLLSRCPNLEHLSLKQCKVIGGENVFNIRDHGLPNLTLEEEDFPQWPYLLKVVAPQLKNLAILDASNGGRQYLISAPGLTSLVVKGRFVFPVDVQGGGFPCLEKADISFTCPQLQDAAAVGRLVRQLHSVRFLALNVKILEVLSSSVEPNSHQPCAKINILKFLTSYPPTAYMEVTGIKSNLQDNFPSAIVTMISTEEIRGMSSIVSAKQLIAELRELLHKYESISYTKKTGERCCYTSGNLEWYRRKLGADVMTRLQRLEGLLTGLPVSNSLAMQPLYSSLREEASIFQSP